MNTKDPKARVHELRALLDHANTAYYRDAAPFMSDIEFDTLLAELSALEAAHPALDDPDSPTRRVGGAPISAFRTVRHSQPMLSIDNTYSESDVLEWHARILKRLATGTDGALFATPRNGGQNPVLVADPKVDGVAISIRFENARLVRALTRGDGVAGDDVTHNIRTIRALPLTLVGSNGVEPPQVLELRGEVFMPLSEFERINQEREAADLELFRNPRNATAGTLKQLDPKITAARRLRFAAHGKGEVSDPGFAGSHTQFLRNIEALGVPTNRPRCVSGSVGEIIAAIERFLGEKHSLDYATDGMVVRVDSFALQDALGLTSKSPRWIIAYKYPAERKTTRLLRVDHQVGKTGKITPRAAMEPVLLAGTLVQHATLHNYGRVRDAATETEGVRTAIHIGDSVLIEKAGEIIPYVCGVVLAERPANAAPIIPPDRCPECGGPVEIEPAEAEANAALETARRCVNPECPAQVREKLIWFAGRKQMDIDGLGEKTVDQIREDAAIPLGTFADIFRLKDHRDRLVSLDRMGEKKIDNLLAGIEAAKGRGLAKLLAGMGIRHVGDTTAKLLARRFKDLDALLAAKEPELRPKACSREEASMFGFAAEPSERPETGLGKDTAPIVHAYLHSEAAQHTFTDLRRAGVDMTSRDWIDPATSSKTKASLPFSGRTMVITGTLDGFEREDLKELLESLGAKVSGSVSSKTSVVVVGSSAGSKLDKARELGIETWDEPRLIEELRAAGART